MVVNLFNGLNEKSMKSIELVVSWSLLVFLQCCVLLINHQTALTQLVLNSNVSLVYIG